LAAANSGLAAALSAALAYGEQDLLASEVSWLRGLLSHRGLSERLLTGYLEAYADASRAALGERGSVVVEWLSRLPARADE
jgi:hypothetical protein